MLIIKIILILIAAFFLCAAIQGIIRANRMTPEEQAAFLQDYKVQKAARKAARKAHSSSHNYWYNKSIDDGKVMSPYERHQYAERQSDKELRKYIKSIK